MVNANNIFIVTGLSDLNKQGQGTGYWKSTRGFLNSDKYIHDSHYYQAYSYEIQTSLSLDYYADLIKQILHVSGTEMFGKTVITSYVDGFDITSNSSITQT